jgi:hypothetical protein
MCTMAESERENGCGVSRENNQLAIVGGFKDY